MADIAELIVALKLRDGVSSGLGRLNGQLKGMSGGLSQVGKGIGQVGTGLDRGLTRGAIAAGGALAFVVHSAVEFEDAFTGVEKTVDASEAQLAGLSSEIRAMSREMPIAATELANIAEQAGALGVAVDDIDEFTRTAALLGVTTDVSSDEAATALGQLSNVLSLTGKDYEAFASTLVDLGNKGASTESAILGIATRAGAAGDLIGLSADQVLAFGSAVANMGIETEAGGSALQKFFIDTLTNLQDEDLLGVMARTAGTTGAAFKQAFEEDAAGALDTFLRGLGKLDEAAQIETLQTLGFNDVRITRMLLGFANNTDNLTDSLNIAEDAFKANTAIQAEAERKFANTASQLKILRNNVTDAAVTIGNELLPVITDLTQDFLGFLNQPGTQAGIREFATDLAEGVRGLAAELKGTDFSGIIGGIQIAASVAKGAFDAFRALPEPIQQLAIAALVANKVSGGAIGSIAAGLGNILLGSLKTITAANVTVIGGNVTGGPGGPGGPAGGSRGFLGNALQIAGGGVLLIGGNALQRGDLQLIDPKAEIGPLSGGQINELAGAAAQIAGGVIAGRAIGNQIAGVPGEIVGGAIGAVAGSGTAAVTAVVGFEEMRQEQRTGLQGILDELPRTPAQINESIERLQAEINQERPLLDGILFNTNVKPQLDAELAELQGIKQQNALDAASGRTEAAANAREIANSTINEFRRGSNERRREANHLSALARAAASSDASLLSTARNQTPILQEGNRRAAQIRDTARDRLNNLAARYESIGAGTNAKLGQIVAKKSTVNVNVTNTIPISLSVSAVTQQIVRLHQARVGTGFTEGVL